MKKGELEKRIKKKLVSILEEAKQEFPKLGIGGSNDLQSIYNYSETTEEALSIALETLQEVKEWFEKWFGENG